MKVRIAAVALRWQPPPPAGTETITTGMRRSGDTMPSDSDSDGFTDTSGDSVAADSTGLPDDVRTAARRYWRRTLAVRALLGVGYFVVSIVILFSLPFLPALALIAVLLVTLVAPVFTSGGTIELTTDRSPAAVREEFTEGMPPLLGFQAALADDIRLTATGAEYDLSGLGGVRSTTFRVETKHLADGDSDAASDDSGVNADAASDADFAAVVTVGDEPWARYWVTTSDCGAETAVRITVVRHRRVGIRRLPDLLFARRYRRRLFEPQGYTLVEENTSLSV